ncbi:hypothetical protein CCACVL1_09231, partial [Corchorus capsularis]
VRDVIEPAKTEPVAQPVAEQRVVEPFKMEVRIEIPIYDGELDPEKLNGWIKQLEVYFSTKSYTDQQKISFSRLRLGNHAVTWWESFISGLEAEGMAPIQTWQEFTAAIKNQFYHLGYEEELKGKWQFLR